MAERFLVGAGVGSGVAHGPAFVLAKPEAALAQISKPGNRIGMIAIQKAMISVAEELENVATVGDAKDVMQALAMISRDPVLFDVVKAHLSEGAEAADAIRRAFARFARQLESLGGYFAERAADLDYLANRVIAELAGELPAVEFPTEPFILVSDSISPLDAAKLDPNRVLAVITSDGTPTSHSAIILRAAQLPMVVGLVGSGLIRTGSDLLVDASSGQVFLDPTEERIEHYSTAASLDTQVIRLLEDEREAPITLLANLGSSFEAAGALAAGAKGVGLFRTELLFLDSQVEPTVEEQVKLYSEGKKEIIKTIEEVKSPKEFSVKGWDVPTENLFVYGKKVTDFRAIDFDQITALSVGAIQELSQQVEKLTRENESLQHPPKNLFAAHDHPIPHAMLCEEYE